MHSTKIKLGHNNLGGKQQDKAVIDGMQVDRDLYPDEEAGDGTEDDQGTYKEFTSWGEPRNEDEDKGGDEDTDSKCKALRNIDDDLEQNLNVEDNGILDAEGFAELWIDM